MPCCLMRPTDDLLISGVGPALETQAALSTPGSECCFAQLPREFQVAEAQSAKAPNLRPEGEESGSRRVSLSFLAQSYPGPGNQGYT